MTFEHSLGRTKSKAAAIITIREAGKMTKQGRQDIADWLRQHAKWVLKHGADYSKTFTGRYLYA